MNEMGATTKMARARASAVRRTLRGRGAVGHWKTTTLTAGLTVRGLMAPMVIDGAMDGPPLRASVETILVSGLRPGDTIVMDKSAIPQGRPRARGQGKLALPAALLAGLNPIEMAFSKLKALLCHRAAHHPIVDAIERFGRQVSRLLLRLRIRCDMIGECSSVPGCRRTYFVATQYRCASADLVMRRRSNPRRKNCWRS